MDRRCLLCQVEDEYHDHLFYAHKYSKIVQNWLLHTNNVDQSCTVLASETGMDYGS